jgi:hypothetical protein
MQSYVGKLDPRLPSIAFATHSFGVDGIYANRTADARASTNALLIENIAILADRAIGK